MIVLFFGILKVVIGFLCVCILKLLVVIDCGSERVMFWNYSIIFNVFLLCDLNDIDVGKVSDFFLFEWFCDVNCSVFCFKSLINNMKFVLRFLFMFFDVNVLYEFFVVVIKGMRWV